MARYLVSEKENKYTTTNLGRQKDFSLSLSLSLLLSLSLSLSLTLTHSLYLCKSLSFSFFLAITFVLRPQLQLFLKVHVCLPVCLPARLCVCVYVCLSFYSSLPASVDSIDCLFFLVLRYLFDYLHSIVLLALSFPLCS